MRGMFKEHMEQKHTMHVCQKDDMLYGKWHTNTPSQITWYWSQHLAQPRKAP